MSRRSQRLSGTWVLASVALGGCASASLPTLPKVELPAASSLTAALPVAGGAEVGPTETYERVARGVLKCWLGAEGPFKGKYVFGAEAKPPSKGGGAELGLHERDPAAPAAQGTRVWRATLTPSGPGTAIEVQSLKLPDATASDMKVDVERWARGNEACASAGATALVPLPPPPAAVVPAKGRATTTRKPRQS